MLEIRAEQLLSRPDLPTSRRPPAEQAGALEHLLETYEGSVTRALGDYQFLVRTETGQLDQAAQLLTDFSQRLDSRGEGRRALLEYNRHGHGQLELFQAALKGVDLDTALERFEQARQADIEPTQRLEALELGQTPALFHELLGHPLGRESVAALRSLLRLESGPGLSGDHWRVRDGAWVLEADSNFRYDLESQPLALNGLLEPRLCFDLEGAGPAELEIGVKPDGSFSNSSQKLDLHNGSVEVPLGETGDRFKLELRVRPENMSQRLSVRLSNPRLVAQQPRLLATPRWSPEGDWGESDDDGFALTWADSPGRDYRPNVNQSLTSDWLDLGGSQRPQLSFKARYDIERFSDKCHLEVRTENQDWQPLDAFNGSSDWQAHAYSLDAFRGQKVQLRFRLQSDDSREKEGIELSACRILDSSPVTATIPLAGHGGEPGRVAEALLAEPRERRDQALASWERIARRAQDTEAALDFWPHLRHDQEQPGQEDAFLTLRQVFGDKAGEWLGRLNQTYQGHELLEQAQLAAQIKDDYGRVQQLLERSQTPTSFYLRLLDHGSGADQVIHQLAVPFGDEQAELRRSWFEKLLERTGDNSEAVTAWKTLSRWVPGPETLPQALNAYLALHTALGRDTQASNLTWRQLQDAQMQGPLLGKSLSACASELAEGLLVGVPLERLMDGLLHGRNLRELVEEVDYLIVGDTQVPRQD
ncbi:MAG: hypothetical protein AB7S38_37035 [Vulcanimicrobiota bacterium]